MVNKIKVARAEKNLTQEGLANLIGVTRQTVSLIENGQYNPTLKLCLAICHNLDRSLDELFWIDKEEL